VSARSNPRVRGLFKKDAHGMNQTQTATLEEVKAALKPLGLEVVGVRSPPPDMCDNTWDACERLVRAWEGQAQTLRSQGHTIAPETLEQCAKELDDELTRNRG
jgi:hypothetical protein